ncbi:MAG TPA: ATP synthase subunit I [Acidimicrobiales bacterium]|nr:ATP synthase subunit I [Acidimicrobiales bacterium]
MATTVRAKPSVIESRDLGPAPEAQVARDLIKRGLIALPFALVLGAIGWGTAGIASVAYAAGLILVNFAVAAALLGWAARVSLGLLMGVCLFGFLIRMAAITAAVLLVRDQSWVAPVPLAVTLIVTHLGLLFWETKFVSASLAFPGLKPSSEEQ